MDCDFFSKLANAKTSNKTTNFSLHLKFVHFDSFLCFSTPFFFLTSVILGFLGCKRRGRVFGFLSQIAAKVNRYVFKSLARYIKRQ